MRKDTTLIETKVLLTKAEDEQLKHIANADGGRSKTNFCTNEIRKIITKRAVRQKRKK